MSDEKTLLHNLTDMKQTVGGAKLHILGGFGHLTRKVRDSEMIYKTSQKQYSTYDMSCDGCRM